METTRPERIRPGDAIRAAWLQELADSVVRRITIIGGRISRSGNSIAIQIDPIRAGGGGKAHRFLLDGVYADHLVAWPWDGTEVTEPKQFAIAKPFLLQQTPHDGVSRNGYTAGDYNTNATTRTVVRDSDSEEEDQILVPNYIIPVGDYTGDEIWAVRAPTGLTYMDGEDERAIEWLDINVDARAWAKVNTE